MRAVGFVRALPGILGPLALTVAVIAVGLRLLNGAPAYMTNLVAGPLPASMVLDERLIYPSVEAAGKDLGVKVHVPAYFPSYLSWPPYSVRGQREPVKVVSFLVRSAEGQQALQVREIFWVGDNLPFQVPEPADLAETRSVEVDGVPAKLLVGTGSDASAVNQLRWHAGGVHFVVTTIYPPEELLRIAGSME